MMHLLPMIAALSVAAPEAVEEETYEARVYVKGMN